MICLKKRHLERDKQAFEKKQGLKIENLNEWLKFEDIFYKD
jgi:hypothetical protein